MARQSYLEHSAVTVRDIEWSKNFFEKILGMTETRRKEKDGHLKMVWLKGGDRKSTRLNSSHITRSRMPSSA